MATSVSPTKKLMKSPAAKAAEAEKPPAKPAVKTAVKAAPKKVEAEADKVEAAESVEQSSEDIIASSAKKIEHLKEAKAFEMVPELQSDMDRNAFMLGGVLAKIQSEGWYQNKGYENFKQYVEAEAGIAYRKAMYLVGIYNALVESGVPWAKVGHLGWTKLKELAPILDMDNVDEWVGIAENMTVLQLQEHIKASTAGTDAGNTPDTDTTSAKEVTTKTFKLKKDQKGTVDEALDKAKHQGNTEHDSVALEYICMDYLSGGGKKPASLKEAFKGKSIEEVLAVIDEAFPLVVISATLYDTKEEADAAKAELQAAMEGEAEAAE